eukprot:8324039-Prorocentrum_lima.AAC.1
MMRAVNGNYCSSEPREDESDALETCWDRHGDLSPDSSQSPRDTPPPTQRQRWNEYCRQLMFPEWPPETPLPVDNEDLMRLAEMYDAEDV